uniref:Uncharacterized protein n=1 Tax=Glossina austeni TaxID=7395 RepID=A0A1A9UY53_GLOAU
MHRSHRKGSSTFVSESEPDQINCLEVSPRISARLSEFNLNEIDVNDASALASKTSFIEDSNATIPDEPRAVAVSENGERYSIDLNDLKENISRSFAASQSTLENTSAMSVQDSFQLKRIDGATENLYRPVSKGHIDNAKLLKKQMNFRRSFNHSMISSQYSVLQGLSRNHHWCKAPKFGSSRRHNNQKHRLIFTPRNLDRLSVSRIKRDSPMIQPRISNTNVQTQTGTDTVLVSKSVQASNLTQENHIVPPSRTKQRLIYTQVNPENQYVPHYNANKHGRYEQHSESQRRLTKSPLTLPPRTRSPSPRGPTLQKPLRAYGHKNSNLGSSYSELRAIASGVTLITVVWWLLSTIFQLGGVSNFVDDVIYQIRKFIFADEKPKTKVELILEFKKKKQQILYTISDLMNGLIEVKWLVGWLVG